MADESSGDKVALVTAIIQNTKLSDDEKESQIRRIMSSHSRTTSKMTNGSTDLTPQQKYDLIIQNLDEKLGEDIMKDIIFTQKRPMSIYWGTATTGRPHCAYFVPMLQIASFLRAGCNVKILLADIHGFLDNLKAPIELVHHRAEYYKFVIQELLKAVGVSIERLEFVLGSSYQLTEKYQMDLLRLSTKVTERDAKRAGAEVVKQVDDAPLSGLIYPLMQTLDEEYLGVDAQFGGTDQRKIFILAKDALPRIGYKERAHLMNPMVPGLTGGKMSASQADSKIDVLDEPEVVEKKLKKAVGVPKEVDNNGLLAFVQYVLLPAGILKHGTPKFFVDRRDAEPLVYETIEKMREDYAADILQPQFLKPAIAKALNELLAPVRAAYEASPRWQEVGRLGYPPAEPEEKKVKDKKKKDKGSKHPGRAVEAQADGHVEGADKEQVDVNSSATEALKDLKTESKPAPNGSAA